jgi:cytochrome P450
VRAKILNRNVAVITSYDHCRQILNASDGVASSPSPSSPGSIVAAHEGQTISQRSFGVLPAYRELMADFFPPPNLLLLDAPDHEGRRRVWNDHMANVCRDASPIIRAIAVDELSTWSHGDEMDLYDKMKDLAWRMLLAIFLELSPADKQYGEVVSRQEALLRGQFSLFPIAINTPFWRSPRSRGLDARRKLQETLKENVQAQTPTCPFHCRTGIISPDELASNALLFTSSIAVKALASLLTASLLNLFLFPGEPSLATRVREQDSANQEIFLKSVLRETERLSPPVIGVMRRVQQEIILRPPGVQDEPPTLIPQGWDVWLYFVGAVRNNSVYEQASKFVPERFVTESGTQPGLAFGLGAKRCLGGEIVRQIVQTVAMVMLDTGVDLHGSVESEGVRGWLGWDDEVPVEMIARDLKQLPCQRPRNPIRLRVFRRR